MSDMSKWKTPFAGVCARGSQHRLAAFSIQSDRHLCNPTTPIGQSVCNLTHVAPRKGGSHLSCHASASLEASQRWTRMPSSRSGIPTVNHTKARRHGHMAIGHGHRNVQWALTRLRNSLCVYDWWPKWIQAAHRRTSNLLAFWVVVVVVNWWPYLCNSSFPTFIAYKL